MSNKEFENIHFIAFNTHYTHRIIDNYEFYKSNVENIGRKLSLYGVYTCPHSYGYNNHPLIYPTNNIRVMEDIKEGMMMERENIVGSILVKNGGNYVVDDNILNRIIESINDFCGFFDMNNLFEHRVVQVRLEYETVNILYLIFDTESG